MILFADLLYAKQSEEKKMCICTQPRWHPLLIQEVAWQSPTGVWAILLDDLVATLLKLCSLWLFLYAFSYLNSLQVQKTCSIPSARLLAFVERRQSLAWPLFTPNLNHNLNLPDMWFHFLGNLRKHIIALHSTQGFWKWPSHCCCSSGVQQPWNDCQPESCYLVDSFKVVYEKCD